MIDGDHRCGARPGIPGRCTSAPGRGAVRRPGDRRRGRRRRRRARRREPGPQGRRWSRPATSPRGPRAGRPSWCTADCATSSSSTSTSCSRRCAERKLILEKLCPHLARAGGVHLPAGEAARRPRLGRHGRRRVRRPRRRPRRAQPPAAPVEEGDAALVPVGQARRDQGRHRLLRGPARRRPAHDGDRPHRGRVRRGGRLEHAGHRPSSATATRSSARSPATWSRARRSGSGPRPPSTRRGSGPTRSRR